MPTYNGLGHLKICLPSLKLASYSQTEVILVDNNSTDETVQYVKKNFPKIKLLRKTQNYGYAKGNDIGFRAPWLASIPSV